MDGEQLTEEKKQSFFSMISERFLRSVANGDEFHILDVLEKLGKFPSGWLAMLSPAAVDGIKRCCTYKGSNPVATITIQTEARLVSSKLAKGNNYKYIAEGGLEHLLSQIRETSGLYDIDVLLQQLHYLASRETVKNQLESLHWVSVLVEVLSRWRAGYYKSDIRSFRGTFPTTLFLCILAGARKRQFIEYMLQKNLLENVWHAIAMANTGNNLLGMMQFLPGVSTVQIQGRAATVHACLEILKLSLPFMSKEELIATQKCIQPTLWKIESSEKDKMRFQDYDKYKEVTQDRQKKEYEEDLSRPRKEINPQQLVGKKIIKKKENNQGIFLKMEDGTFYKIYHLPVKYWQGGGYTWRTKFIKKKSIQSVTKREETTKAGVIVPFYEILYNDGDEENKTKVTYLKLPQQDSDDDDSVDVEDLFTVYYDERVEVWFEEATEAEFDEADEPKGLDIDYIDPHKIQPLVSELLADLNKLILIRSTESSSLANKISFGEQKRKVNRSWLPAVCGGCSATEKTKGQFKLCSRCRTVVYCDKNCQTKDWAQHKTICFKKT